MSNPISISSSNNPALGVNQPANKFDMQDEINNLVGPVLGPQQNNSPVVPIPRPAISDENLKDAAAFQLHANDCKQRIQRPGESSNEISTPPDERKEQCSKLVEEHFPENQEAYKERINKSQYPVGELKKIIQENSDNKEARSKFIQLKNGLIRKTAQDLTKAINEAPPEKKCEQRKKLCNFLLKTHLTDQSKRAEYMNKINESKEPFKTMEGILKEINKTSPKEAKNIINHLPTRKRSFDNNYKIGTNTLSKITTLLKKNNISDQKKEKIFAAIKDGKSPTVICNLALYAIVNEQGSLLEQSKLDDFAKQLEGIFIPRNLPTAIKEIPDNNLKSLLLKNIIPNLTEEQQKQLRELLQPSTPEPTETSTSQTEPQPEENGLFQEIRNGTKLKKLKIEPSINTSTKNPELFGITSRRDAITGQSDLEERKKPINEAHYNETNTSSKKTTAFLKALVQNKSISISQLRSAMLELAPELPRSQRSELVEALNSSESVASPPPPPPPPPSTSLRIHPPVTETLKDLIVNKHTELRSTPKNTKEGTTQDQTDQYNGMLERARRHSSQPENRDDESDDDEWDD